MNTLLERVGGYLSTLGFEISETDGDFVAAEKAGMIPGTLSTLLLWVPDEPEHEEEFEKQIPNSIINVHPIQDG